MKLLSVKKSADFKQLSKTGEKFYSKTVLLLSLPTSEFYFQDLAKHKNAQNFCRVGYTVSKTIGKAATRNLAKRRLREAFRSLAPSLARNHHDYVLIARKEIAESNLTSITNDLKFCLKRIHQLRSYSKNEKPKN